MGCIEGNFSLFRIEPSSVALWGIHLYKQCDPFELNFSETCCFWPNAINIGTGMKQPTQYPEGVRTL
jgi:hypothetical protein